MGDRFTQSIFSKVHVHASLLIFFLVLSFCVCSILGKEQLGFLQGMTEEYVKVAYRLHTTGSIYEDSAVDAFVFRPPGYIYFVAAVLRVSGISPRDQLRFSTESQAFEYLTYVGSQICIAHALLLSCTAVLLFLWISRFTCLWTAFLIALSFGLNPYSIIYTGLMHYATLHIFCVVLSGYALTLAVTGQDRRPFKEFLTGCLWGLTTLVRPLTLILPFFVFILYFIRYGRSFKRAIGSLLIFCLGMGVVISPYTARNYVKTQQFIPVNAQSGIALWAATSPQTKPAANYYNWWNLWYGEGMKVYQRVFPDTPYNAQNHIRNCLRVEQEFQKEAFLNLRKQPDVFWKNVAQNVVTFNSDINSVFIKLFQRVQENPPPNNIFQWLVLNTPQDFYSPVAANAFYGLIVLLHILGFIGICVAFFQRDQGLLVPILLYCCFCLAHAITYMDIMYYYIKIPFLFLFAAYFLGWLQTYTIDFGRLGIPKRISVATLSSLCLLICVQIINVIVFL